MRTTIVLLTGAVLSLTLFGGSADSSAEERYRMKYGRYTPAEEVRQKAQREAQANAATAAEVATCCRYMNASLQNARVADTFVESHFRIKYGQGTPAAEARQRAAAEETAAHVRRCEELGKCTLMPADARAAASSAPLVGESWREAWFRAKYGRSLPVKTEEPELLASADRMSCENECCKHAQ
jgi:hypothetical protein